VYEDRDGGYKIESFVRRRLKYNLYFPLLSRFLSLAGNCAPLPQSNSSLKNRPACWCHVKTCFPSFASPIHQYSFLKKRSGCLGAACCFMQVCAGKLGDQQDRP
jgi:hypothetical protein